MCGAFSFSHLDDGREELWQGFQGFFFFFFFLSLFRIIDMINHVDITCYPTFLSSSIIRKKEQFVDPHIAL